MRTSIRLFAAGFILAVIAVTAMTAWALPKTFTAHAVCQCQCAVQGASYPVNVSAPNNDPNTCGNLNGVSCTMGAGAGSNNKGKLEGCSGAVVVDSTHGTTRPQTKPPAATAK